VTWSGIFQYNVYFSDILPQLGQERTQAQIEVSQWHSKVEDTGCFHLTQAKWTMSMQKVA
jgi:hypothetical protein